VDNDRDVGQDHVRYVNGVRTERKRDCHADRKAKDRHQHEISDDLQTARQNQSMRLNPYLNFPGNCAAAFQFYEQHLGGKITMTITFADSPLADEVPPEWRGKILHTRMMVGRCGADGRRRIARGLHRAA
jgi:hypothetical protein